MCVMETQPDESSTHSVIRMALITIIGDHYGE